MTYVAWTAYSIYGCSQLEAYESEELTVNSEQYYSYEYFKLKDRYKH